MFDQSLMKGHWKKYVLERDQEVPSRTLVKEAWDRCLAMDVDPQDGIGRVLDKESLDRRLAKNHRLIEIARPIMTNLYETIQKTSYSIILTDAEGVLLHVLENNNIETKHKNLNFVAGTYWNERNVGSNAIGTALAIDRPVQMVGAEHFCVTHHGWTCSAAPIHDEMGQVIGCLDFSGRVEDVQTHTFGMVTTAAEIIEKQWALENSRELMDTAFNAILDGMIILDGRRQITFVNRKMREILFGSSEASDEGLTVDAIFPGLDLELPVFTEHKPLRYADYSFHFRGKKIDCLLNIAPILAEDRVSGAVIYVKEAHQVRRVVNQIAGYRATFTFRDILTEDPQMKQIITFAKRIAVTDATVLIQGESGTGKELFAQAIHSRSPRHREPFIAINCAALPRDLVESELFGYEKGSFTGAVKEGKPGKLELADGGTLFLDEIGELPLELQSKLLRFLDDQTVTRIGGTHERVLNVRVLAATNRDLLEEVRHRTFREDLYYRLNVINLVIPPLRERRGDILPLATAYLERLNRGWAGEEKRFSNRFFAALTEADWPGNVRELHNAVHRAFYASAQTVIDSPVKRRSGTGKTDRVSAGVSLETVERLALVDALDRCGGDVLEAARTLSIGKSTVYRKIKSYAIDLSRFRQ